MEKIIRTESVVAYNKNTGMFYGVSYADGHFTAYGDVPIEKASIGNPEYCKKPSNMTYTTDPERDNMDNNYELVKLVKTVKYEIFN